VNHPRELALPGNLQMLGILREFEDLSMARHSPKADISHIAGSSGFLVQEAIICTPSEMDPTVLTPKRKINIWSS
jgi:hypothetical protein